MESRESWERRLDLRGYVAAPPWMRFFINRERRARGLPPLRAREARAELRGLG